MKKVICLLSLFAAIPAFANTNKLEIIKQNPEVKSVVAAFEANRSQKCVEITESNTRIGKSGAVKVVVSCNQYDENGEPKANVYFITIRGYLYDSFFEMDSVAIVGAE